MKKIYHPQPNLYSKMQHKKKQKKKKKLNIQFTTHQGTMYSTCKSH